MENHFISVNKHKTKNGSTCFCLVVVIFVCLLSEEKVMDGFFIFILACPSMMANKSFFKVKGKVCLSTIHTNEPLASHAFCKTVSLANTLSTNSEHFPLLEQGPELHQYLAYINSFFFFLFLFIYLYL